VLDWFTDATVTVWCFCRVRDRPAKLSSWLFTTSDVIVSIVNILRARKWQKKNKNTKRQKYKKCQILVGMIAKSIMHDLTESYLSVQEQWFYISVWKKILS